ncbi:hypothetical protein LTR91_022236 [Friedmanniomyces endolithicus]|uniref:C2H2-type domain-containing protein n=1 Tax=Friedmanniomyces endolithicus TaxID=329885 RepID=A0AAN6HB58_9PEZI|nr:hypothetical protein LTR94_018964 [Friedmanniomyces endolithicus]KAK0772064.1 hypothetical protein LTR59_015833 [Friedmanniomyces endolithicus]KAK0778707.1 hypothetical protein LTR75_015569 [Friedmanniomyces endolithicus]KAK0835450.1 hypothetical protein LTR03_013922 [Friedmanniomyces endolithicus]KAK0889887.1 hypothetical protein LTR02_015107 [Friedmanniomyces endolithicus]
MSFTLFRPPSACPSVAQHTDYVTPDLSPYDQQAVEVGDFGYVSIRDIHRALACSRQCTCHGGMAAAKTEYPYTPPPSTGLLDDFPDYPEATDPMFDTSGYVYASPDEPSWLFLDYNATPPYSGVNAPQFATEPLNTIRESFDIGGITSGASQCGTPSFLRTRYESCPPTGGNDRYSPAAGHVSIDTATPRDCSDSDDSTVVENKARFVCSECREGFPTYYTLESHARETAHRAYVCPEPGCNSRYYRRDVFVRHIKTHRESGLHFCNVCANSNHHKTFKRKDHLRQHIQQLHPGISIQDASGKTPCSRSSSTSTYANSDAPSCRGGSATLGGDRLKAALVKDRGGSLDRS